MRISGYGGPGAMWYGPETMTRGRRTTDYRPPTEGELQQWRKVLSLKLWRQSPLEIICANCRYNRDRYGRCPCDLTKVPQPYVRPVRGRGPHASAMGHYL